MKMVHIFMDTESVVVGGKDPPDTVTDVMYMGETWFKILTQSKSDTEEFLASLPVPLK